MSHEEPRAANHSVDRVLGFHFSGKKIPFWKWNDPEIGCVNRNNSVLRYGNRKRTCQIIRWDV